MAVSGGADSLALAMLASAWAAARGGLAIGLIVDHGLRAESAREAEETAHRLAAIGMAAVVLTVTGLVPGPGVAARARAARHAALEGACAARGILHLLFGHHARDQAETLMIRAAAGSGGSGLAGMAALSETALVRRLRPLLDIPPGRLRATLRAAGSGWVEDPSNQDMTQHRARVRLALDDPEGDGWRTRAACAAALHHGVARRAAEAGIAAVLAEQVAVYPEGYALLRPGPVPAPALASLLGMLSGAAYPPSARAVAAMAAAPRPGTLAGVQLLPAGRLGPGLLLVREAAAMAPDCAAINGLLWDGRYRLTTVPPAGAVMGGWGAQARGDRRGLPAAVARSLPVLRLAGEVIACGPGAAFAYAPRRWMTDACFFPFAPDV